MTQGSTAPFWWWLAFVIELYLIVRAFLDVKKEFDSWIASGPEIRKLSPDDRAKVEVKRIFLVYKEFALSFSRAFVGMIFLFWLTRFW